MLYLLIYKAELIFWHVWLCVQLCSKCYILSQQSSYIICYFLLTRWVALLSFSFVTHWPWNAGDIIRHFDQFHKNVKTLVDKQALIMLADGQSMSSGVALYFMQGQPVM